MTLARDWRRPLYEIEGLVSFYPHFRTSPPDGARGGRLPRPVLLARARRGAEVPEGATVHEVSCVGRCDRAPVAVVDEQRLPRADRGGGRRPNDPYASADEHYGVLRRLTGDPVPCSRTPACGDGRRRLPDRARSGRWSAARTTRSST